MSIEVREVKTKKQLKEYIYLPSKIHKNHKTWLPPLYIDEWSYYNTKKNKAFSYCDTILLLAYKDNVPVGRIFGIINHRYNEKYNEKHGRFTFLEAYEDQNIVHALISYVENWAKQKGMVRMIGPFGFSDKDPEGFLIEGFEHIPILVTACNLEYMPRLLANEGYIKKIDCLDYLVNIKTADFTLYKRILSRMNAKNEYTLVEFAKRKELRQYIIPIFRLMNECYSDIYGYDPMSETEMNELAKRYLPIINPGYVKVVEKDGEVLAFIVGIPNMSRGIIKSKGKLLPFGIFYILRAAKKSKQIDLALGGVKDKYRGLGLEVMLGTKFVDTCTKNGIEGIDTHLVLETNTKMRAEYERLGAKVIKRFRVFQKELKIEI